ncbi:MAG: hypothetical protein KY463_10505, partial [Actinobacteria bacterium]|nr:hypothetical protein [Actinomycetota bacterium]
GSTFRRAASAAAGDANNVERRVDERRRLALVAGPDWRERFFRELRAVSPDPAERAAYHAELDALEAQPPCPRCGWKDAPAFRIVARDDWSWAAGSTHDEPA